MPERIHDVRVRSRSRQKKIRRPLRKICTYTQKSARMLAGWLDPPSPSRSPWPIRRCSGRPTDRPTARQNVRRSALRPSVRPTCRDPAKPKKRRKKRRPAYVRGRSFHPLPRLWMSYDGPGIPPLPLNKEAVSQCHKDAADLMHWGKLKVLLWLTRSPACPPAYLLCPPSLLLLHSAGSSWP